MATEFRDSQLLTLDTVMDRIRQDDEDKHDLVVKFKHIQIHTEPFAAQESHMFPGLKAQASMPRLVVNQGLGKGNIKLNFDTRGRKYRAFRQFCQMLNSKMNPAYVLECNQGLALSNLDYWRQVHGEEDILIRYRAPEGKSPYLRAVLPSTRVPIDNSTFFPMVHEHCRELGMRVANFRITDYGFFGRLVVPEEHEVSKSDPDPLYMGLCVANSETGARPLTMDNLLFELICSNGMIVPHESKNLLKQKHVRIENSALSGEISAAVSTFASSRPHLLEKYQRAREIKVDDPAMEVRALLTGTRSIGGAQTMKVALDVVEEDYKDVKTRAGVVRALTDASQRLGDPDLRQRIDRAAGQYLLNGLIGLGLQAA